VYRERKAKEGKKDRKNQNAAGSRYLGNPRVSSRKRRERSGWSKYADVVEEVIRSGVGEQKERLAGTSIPPTGTVEREGVPPKTCCALAKRERGPLKGGEIAKNSLDLRMDVGIGSPAARNKVYVKEKGNLKMIKRLKEKGLSNMVSVLAGGPGSISLGVNEKVGERLK